MDVYIRPHSKKTAESLVVCDARNTISLIVGKGLALSFKRLLTKWKCLSGFCLCSQNIQNGGLFAETKNEHTHKNLLLKFLPIETNFSDFSDGEFEPNDPEESEQEKSSEQKWKWRSCSNERKWISRCTRSRHSPRSCTRDHRTRGIYLGAL